MMLMVYILLVIVRVLSVVQRGYIHPDEFFQGGQELFFGCHSHPTHHTNSQLHDDSDRHKHDDNDWSGIMGNGNSATNTIRLNGNLHGLLGGDSTMEAKVVATWEFQQEHALRSILPPLFMTVLPLRLYSILKHSWSWRNEDCGFEYNWRDLLTGWEIWIIPRIFMAILSILTLDVPIWYMATTLHKHRSTYGHGYGLGRRTNETQYRGKKFSILPMMRVIEVPIEVLVFATSWVTLAFLNRPFTNTLETMALSILCSLVVHDCHHHHHHKTRELSRSSYTYTYVLPGAVGITCAIGLFTRFTFVIFAFPVVIALLYHRFANATQKPIVWTQQQNSDDDKSESSNIIRSRWWYDIAALRQVSWTIVMMGIAFTSTSACFIYCDTIFYKSQSQPRYSTSNGDSSSSPPASFTLTTILQSNFVQELVITPWNALRYNSMTENLSEHGLHPRITHALVNLPMLFGPLACFFYVIGIKRFIVKSYQYVQQRQTRVQTHSYERQEHEYAHQHDTITNVSMMMMIEEYVLFPTLAMALGVLSLAPHQEPRFLLPLIIPLTLLYAWQFLEKRDKSADIVEDGKDDDDDDDADKSRSTAPSKPMKYWMFIIWIVFNGLLMTFFGGLHQAGVVPSLLTLPFLHGSSSSLSPVSMSSSSLPSTQQQTSPLAIVFYHTYMPPSFLMRQSFVNDVTTRQQKESLCSTTPILDLQGAEPSILFDTLRHMIPCPGTENYDADGNDNDGLDNKWVHLVMPRSCMGMSFDTDLSSNANDVCQENDSSSLSSSHNDAGTWKEYQWKEVWNSAFQVATEDMPQFSFHGGYHQGIFAFFHDSTLVNYQIRCNISQ